MKLDPRKMITASRTITDFQRKVYLATLAVPKGRITTYKLLARHIKCKSSQAVGQALKRNPFAPHVPCHRVISSTLRIGGFAGQVTGVQISRKIQLLESEGIIFSDGRLANPRQIFRL